MRNERMFTDYTRKYIKRKFRVMRKEIAEAEVLFDAHKSLQAKEKMWSCERFSKHISQSINYFHLASPDKRSLWEATPDEVKQLDNLNNQFTEIEKGIAVEGNRIKAELKARLEAKDEQFLDDFEVDTEISYYLAEDDPAYTDQDEEGIIAIDNIFGIPDDGDDEINWNDNAGSMEGQVHCHLFHSLTDHITPKLKLADVLRIGRVWVDINVMYQKDIKLT